MHTPGPWSVRTDGRIGVLIQEDETGYSVATVYHDKVRDSAADTNLILAAPDMLDALRRIVRNSDRMPDSDPYFNAAMFAARAAIAKAEGK